MKFAFIQAHSSEFSVKKMCVLLGVSRSGYYEFLTRPSCPRNRTDSDLLQKIRGIHRQSRNAYGFPKITRALRDSGLTVNHKRVARIMRENGIRGVITPRFRIRTTDSSHDFPVAPNRLEQNFQANAPGRVWLSDITYIPYRQGFLYLCVVQDLFNREPIGWSLATHMRTDMVVSALKQALLRSPRRPGLIFHSDRGSQYASIEFRKALSDNGIIQSMSRKGNCYDNAPMESFLKTLKVEEVYRKKYESFQDAKRNLFEYIEIFYRRQRIHSTLNYMTPVQYREKFTA